MFDLPPQLLESIRQKDLPLSQDSQLQPSTEEERGSQESNKERTITDGPSLTTSCALCGVSVGNVKDQRNHVRSDLHRYNLKQRMKGLQSVSEEEFENLIGGRNSIVGRGNHVR